MELKEVLKHAEEWEKHHVPTIKAPVMSTSMRLHSIEDRLSGAITDFAGSMKFVYLHTFWFGIWVVVNGGLLLGMGLGLTPFDPFPFGLLTLVVSLEAIFLSTFVMIAQNRLAGIADARAQADFEVNQRAEREVSQILFLMQALVAHHAAEEQAEAAAGSPAVEG